LGTTVAGRTIPLKASGVNANIDVMVSKRSKYSRTSAELRQDLALAKSRAQQCQGIDKPLEPSVDSDVGDKPNPQMSGENEV
jgi:hypothetical protein